MRPGKAFRTTTLFVVAALLSSGTAFAATQQSRPRYSQSQSGYRSWTVPADTVLSVMLNGELTSRNAHVGDRFTATVTVPVHSGRHEVIPAGSTVEGHVSQVTPAKRMSKPGTIGLEFDHLVFPGGARIPLIGNLTSDDPETRERIDDESRVSGERGRSPAVFVGGGGVLGAVLGGVAGGGKGAAIGGIIGAGAGVAGVLLSKGEEARVPGGTPFGVQLTQPLVISESVSQDSDPLDSVANSGRDPDPVSTPADTPASVSAESSDRDTGSTPAADATPADTEPRPSIAEIPSTSTPETSAPEEASAEAPVQDNQPLSSREMISRAQTALKEQGYYEGQADGVMNARTSTALKTYQKENKLPQTGDLDPETARSLGILGPRNAARSTSNRPAVNNPPPTQPARTSPAPPASTTALATVLSATANRTADGAINIVVHTQAPSAGWRWFGDHVINGDTLEVYARGIRPSGPAAAVMTRGRLELNVRGGIRNVNRVVVHGATGEIEVPVAGLRPVASQPNRPAVSQPTRPVSTPATSPLAADIQRKSEQLLADYQSAMGMRLIAGRIEVQRGRRYNASDLELLFAFDAFAGAAQLYTKLMESLQDRDSLRGTTLALAREARKADRLAAASTSGLSDPLALKWDSIRQDVLRLMGNYNINASEVD